MTGPMTYLALLATPIAAAIICALLIVVLRPFLVRYAMARPNARSSHTVPTPQGGGMAVIAATILAVLLSSVFTNIRIDAGLLTVFAAAVFLACVGVFDDLKPIPVAPRLLLQAIAIGVVLGSLPKDYHLFGFLPFWGERALLLIAGLWFVNLVNFMDGLDWMTVAEMVPMTAALTLFGLAGNLHGNTTITAMALGGALIGFAPFNRPVAKLFLGDVGSLPIGLLTGWCLLQLAGNGNLPAAILLPLYYLADATITLFRRIGNGEEVWVAHRTHFYQRATDNGFSVLRVVGEVFVFNIALAILAAITVYTDSTQTDLIALAIGAIMVVLVLIRFSRPRAKA